MAELSNRVYKISRPDEAAEFVFSVIAQRLVAGPVLWLVSGGSAVEVEVLAAERLSRLDGLARLTVSLIDERYGPPGHPDSNWQKLKQAGFKLDGAVLAPVLKGASLADTAIGFNHFLKTGLERADYALGLVGMGADGHIAGLLPGCPALRSDRLAASYRAEDYTRLTITPGGLARLDEVILYALGEAKRSALKSLISGNRPVKDQPAQIIKKVPRYTVFNDLMGEEL
jgi:6-phosphogluconolactonase